MKTRFAFLAVVMVLGWAAADAHAGRRVAVLEFEGAKAADWQKAVTRLVGRHHDVVSARSFQKTAKRMRARDLSERNIARVSSALDVDGVIEGFVERDDGQYVLRLRLREGATGKTVRKFTLRMSSPRFKTKTKRKLTDKLDAAIVELPPLDEVPPAGMDDEDDWDEDVVDDEPVRDRRDEVRVDRDDDPTEVRSSRRDRDRDDDRDDGPRAAPARDFRSRAMSVTAGASLVGRNLTLTSADYLGDQAPAGYQGTLVPGLFVAGELYPLGLDPSSKGGAAGIGIGFVYDRSAPFDTKISGAMDIVMPTQSTRWGVNARYRHLFGTSETSPSVVVSAGYGKLEFAIDQSGVPMNVLVDIPNVSYTYYDPGLALRLPVGKAAAITAEGKFLLVTTAGEINDADQYGAAKITGLDADIGIEYRLTNSLMLRLGGRYLAMGYSFDGTGEQSNNRDGFADTQDVGGALDKYIGGYLTAGFLF